MDLLRLYYGSPLALAYAMLSRGSFRIICMKMLGSLGAFAILLGTARGQAPPQAVDVGGQPFHKRVLKNEFTRVFRVELAPGQASEVHRHRHDYVAVHLSAAEIENARQGRQPVLQTVRFGEVRFAEGGFSHRVSNTGNTPFRVLAIDILKKRALRSGTAATPNSERGMELGSGSSVDVIVDNEEVRVSETLLGPGATLEKQRRRWPSLIVALSELELHQIPAGKPEAKLRAQTGDLRWVPAAGDYSLMNMGKQQARFITVEFK